VGDDPPEDHYALLGVAASADEVELRRAWRRIARRWHPDRAGAGATATFQRISAAYLVLSDPIARASYDRRRGTAPAPAATPARRAPATMLSRVSGPLVSLLACGIARHAERHVIELHLEPEEAAEGGIVTISMRVPVRTGDTVGEDLFSAWLTVPAGVADGTVLTPSVLLRGMVDPVRFRIRVAVR
jgi:molecular chaperone DnaJ